MSGDDFQTVFNLAPISAVIIQNNRIQQANQKFLNLCSYSITELTRISLRKLLSRQDYRKIITHIIRSLSSRPDPSVCQFKMFNRHGKAIEVFGFFSLTKWHENPAIFLHLLDRALLDSYTASLIENKTQSIFEAWQDSETKYKEVTDSLPEVIFETDTKGNIIFANLRAYGFFEAGEADFHKGINAFDYIAPQDQKRIATTMERILQGEHLGFTEYLLQKKTGAPFPVMIHSTRVMRAGVPVGLRGVILDITEQKKAEQQLLYLSQHDALTGLYNRPYFESMMNTMQQGGDLLGIIVLDMDGLKLINDTLGHSHGDQLLIAVADILREIFRENQILARIGGDEFAILMNNIDESSLKNYIQKLHSSILSYNQSHTQIPLNISCGFALGVGSLAFPSSLFKEADNNMRKEKLYHSQSSRSAIVQTLMKALEARDYITEGHADRLQELVMRLTNKIGLSESSRNDLRLFAQFHDIGKVGIPDRILFKDGPLTKEEAREMRRHSEIGYRIALSAPDLAPIAEWILKHHEWWNGNGYPLGLKGEKIPLACRILAIVDAFDAMTNDRPYRKSLSITTALAELKKFAGTQFDPELVNSFVKVVTAEAEG